MQSYPFTSDKITYDEHGLPKYDRAVDSAFLRKVFAQYFSDGVFYSSANALQVVADTGMQVAVEPGSCHIQGAIGIETNRRTLVVQAAEEMDRIDTVVARLDLSLAVRSIDLYVVKGTAAESPQAPALTRDSTIWELGLANLFVTKNVTTISQQRITDTRLDTSRCGQVGAPVQPPFDTEAFFSQLEAAIQAHQEDAEAQIEQLRNAIEAVEGDAAWMMKEHYDPAGLGKDITVQTYTHSKSGTVHEFTGTGANGRAKMTADVQAGDTFTVNGAPVTAYMGAEDAADSMAGSEWNGKWVSFVVDGSALNFKGGGGLGTYRVIAAATEPETAADGTILVLTGTPMNKYSLRRYTTEITAPETGEVCFLIGSEGSYVEIDKKGVYATYITEARQYDGSEWQKLTWYVRKDGEWAPPKTVLYSPGNTHGTITGGWSGGSLGSSYMSVTASNSGYGGPTYTSLSTAGKIDLTNYKVLCARVKHISGNGTSWNMRIGAGPSTAHAYQQPYYSNAIGSSMSGEDTVVADISNATGKNYVVATIGGGVWQTSDTMAVYDVWLA